MWTPISSLTRSRPKVDTSSLEGVACAASSFKDRFTGNATAPPFCSIRRCILSATSSNFSPIFTFLMASLRTSASMRPASRYLSNTSASCTYITNSFGNWVMFLFPLWVITATVSYTHLRAHETRHDLVCRLLLEKKKKKQHKNFNHAPHTNTNIKIKNKHTHT